MLALALPASAWASCTWLWSVPDGAGHYNDYAVPGPFIIEFDGTVNEVDANAPKGTILFSQTYASSNFVPNYPNGAPRVECTQQILYWQRVVMTGSSLGYIYDDDTYQTNLPGVGLQLTGNDGGYPFNGPQQNLGAGTSTQFSSRTTYRVRLVKTIDGPLTTMGSITGTIGEWRIDQGGPIAAIRFNMRTPIVITPRKPTCAISTPDVVVSLDQKALSDFASVGDALGDKDFSVSLACSGGDPNSSTDLHMFLTDQTTLTNQTNILSLTAASTASGVGVQIVNNGTPVTFGQTLAAPTTDISRNIVVNTPTVDIPLKARYVRTGNMSAGSVTAIATFTATYN